MMAVQDLPQQNLIFSLYLLPPFLLLFTHKSKYCYNSSHEKVFSICKLSDESYLLRLLNRPDFSAPLRHLIWVKKLIIYNYNVILYKIYLNCITSDLLRLSLLFLESLCESSSVLCPPLFMITPPLRTLGPGTLSRTSMIRIYIQSRSPAVSDRYVWSGWNAPGSVAHSSILITHQSA